MRALKSCVPILLTALAFVLIAAACYPPTPAPAPEPSALPPSLTPTVAAKSAPPAAALSLEQLQNGAYLSQLVTGGKVVLKDGGYELATGAGATQKLQVTLVEPVAFGDLNRDGLADAAVILAAYTGGSGVFAELHAVVNDAGQLKDVANVPLGDRIQVKSVAVREGTVILSLMTQGPKDPLCCPTQAVTQTYQLKGDQLTLASIVQLPTISLAAPLAVSRPITLTMPTEGQAIKSGAVISGSLAAASSDSNLRYWVYAGSDGKVLGSGSLAIKGEPGKPVTFSGPVTFVAGTEKVGRIAVADLRDAASAVTVRAAVNVSLGAALPPFAGKPRILVITAPKADAAVSSPVSVLGTTSITPGEKNLIYRIYAGDQLVGFGPISVKGEPGHPGSFDAKAEFKAAGPGPVRIQVLEQDMASGFIVAEAWVDVNGK